MRGGSELNAFVDGQIRLFGLTYRFGLFEVCDDSEHVVRRLFVDVIAARAGLRCLVVAIVTIVLFVANRAARLSFQSRKYLACNR